ncbi:ATP-binding protein [Anatilimnocola sp. NA78]|uniref:ATP-binding protein n=1 Tax=Anatilimnocola sp. NA78 TaxID=3415683 RepID=UPI003CE539BC
MSSSAPLDLGTARLRWLYIAALSAVALLSISGQVLVQRSLRQQQSDSTIVNLAGRQRMLSQKLTKAALAGDRATSDESRAKCRLELKETLAIWQQTHQGLQFGDKALQLPGKNSPAIAAHFARLQPTFDEMVAAANTLLQSPAEQLPAAALDTLLQREADYLTAMDAAVFQFDREAQARVARLQRIEWLLLLLTILVLLLEGALIFRPAVARIQRAGSELMESRRQLELAKEAAESASEQKTRFLANISHELRNPLHAILGNAELAGETSLSNQQRLFLETIKDSATSLRSLVDELLDLACMQAGKLRVFTAPFDVCNVAERCVAMLRPIAEQKGLRLESELPTESVYLFGDSLRVQQIILNLLGNAIKFTQQGSVTLRLGLLRPHAGVRIDVIDSGPGIAPHLQPAIFDAFIQGNNRSPHEQAGVGLGLAISKGLVELMSGCITLESTPGSGSKFTVELPLERSFIASLTSEPTSKPVPITRGLKVLVAEDDPVNQRLITDFLQLLGHQQRLAVNGREALEYYEQIDWDLGLLDWSMPEVDGLEVARQIRQREAKDSRPRIPLIVISAAGAVANAEDAKQAGIDLILIKPVGLDELRTAINALVNNGTPSPLPGAQSVENRWSQPLARMLGKRELFREVAQTFLEQLPHEVHALADLAARHEFPELTRTAHLLRGQAANFDATVLMNATEQLEVAATACNAERCVELSREVAIAGEELQTALRSAIIEI